jgi:hypothetical protein
MTKSLTKIVAFVTLAITLAISSVAFGGHNQTCQRNYPLWYYIGGSQLCGPSVAPSIVRCADYRHSSGSSCYNGGDRICYEWLAWDETYENDGTCVQIAESNVWHCVYSDGGWYPMSTTSAGHEVLVPTCIDAVDLGGGGEPI